MLAFEAAIGGLYSNNHDHDDQRLFAQSCLDHWSRALEVDIERMRECFVAKVAASLAERGSRILNWTLRGSAACGIARK